MFWKETGITSNAFINRDIDDQFLRTQTFAQHRCKIHHVQSPNSYKNLQRKKNRIKTHKPHLSRNPNSPQIGLYTDFAK
jgi:hypothetical protein